MPQRARPVSDDAPQSMRKFAESPATWKHVLSRPPDPKASPQPTNCRCMASARVRPPAPDDPHHDPDRHHDHGPEQEIAPQPDQRLPALAPDVRDQVDEALPDVERI